jgi:hypothetical protein
VILRGDRGRGTEREIVPDQEKGPAHSTSSKHEPLITVFTALGG